MANKDKFRSFLVYLALCMLFIFFVFSSRAAIQQFSTQDFLFDVHDFTVENINLTTDKNYFYYTLNKTIMYSSESVTIQEWYIVGEDRTYIFQNKGEFVFLGVDRNGEAVRIRNKLPDETLAVGNYSIKLIIEAQYLTGIKRNFIVESNTFKITD